MAVFSSTSVGKGRLPRGRIVVEIVDVISLEFHKVQQVRFSKLLNLKICKEGDPRSPRRFSAFLENYPIFNSLYFNKIRPACGKLLKFVERWEFRILNFIYKG